MKIHPIRVPEGFEPVINGNVMKGRKLIHVAGRDQVHLLSCLPFLVTVAVDVYSNEKILHHINITVRLRFDAADAEECIRFAGYSTYREQKRVTVEGHVTLNHLQEEIRSGVARHFSTKGLLELEDHEAVIAGILGEIVSPCRPATCEIVHCDIVAETPDEELMANLAAKSVTNTALSSVVDYFRSAIRERQFIEAETERTKVQAQKEIEKARTDLKLFQEEEAERLADAKQQAATRAEQRQIEEKERNARLKMFGVKLDMDFQKEKLRQEAEVIQQEVDLAKARVGVEAEKREALRLDQQVEIEGSREFYRMRADEIVRIVKELPVPDLSHLQTVVSSGKDGDLTGELTVGWVLSLLQAMSGPHARPTGTARGLPSSMASS